MLLKILKSFRQILIKLILDLNLFIFTHERDRHLCFRGNILKMAYMDKNNSGNGMAECAASWTEDLKVGSSILALARGYLIFRAQKDERHQGAHP